jgi:hypothetical protein
MGLSILSCHVIRWLQGRGDNSTRELGCPLLMFLDLNMPHCTGFASGNGFAEVSNSRATPFASKQTYAYVC